MEPGTEDWADKVTLEGVHKLQKKVQGTCNAIKKSQILKSFFLIMALCKNETRFEIQPGGIFALLGDLLQSH